MKEQLKDFLQELASIRFEEDDNMTVLFIKRNQIQKILEKYNSLVNILVEDIKEFEAVSQEYIELSFIEGYTMADIMNGYIQVLIDSFSDEAYKLEKADINIYIAGSLFSEAEVSQRNWEGDRLRDYLEGTGVRFDIFNPIENPFNDKSTSPTALDIFWGDTNAMKDATHILMNLDNQLDAGVFVELGQLIGLDANSDKKIYPVISDIRMPNAGDYKSILVPWGINQYVIGALTAHNPDLVVYNSAEKAISAIVRDIHNS